MTIVIYGALKNQSPNIFLRQSQTKLDEASHIHSYQCWKMLKGKKLLVAVSVGSGQLAWFLGLYILY